MAKANKPQDDAKDMIAAYEKGTPISVIAEEYNHTAEEVEAIVTKPVEIEEPITQAELDAAPVTPAKVADKKGK